jgi:hypothetical protein
MFLYVCVWVNSNDSLYVYVCSYFQMLCWMNSTLIGAFFVLLALVPIFCTKHPPKNRTDWIPRILARLRIQLKSADDADANFSQTRDKKTWQVYIFIHSKWLLDLRIDILEQALSFVCFLLLWVNSCVFFFSRHFFQILNFLFLSLVVVWSCSAQFCFSFQWVLFGCVSSCNAVSMIAKRPRIDYAASRAGAIVYRPQSTKPAINRPEAFDDINKPTTMELSQQKKTDVGFCTYAYCLHGG